MFVISQTVSPRSCGINKTFVVVVVVVVVVILPNNEHQNNITKTAQPKADKYPKSNFSPFNHCLSVVL